MGFLVVAGMSTLKAFSVTAGQTESQIHILDGFAVIDKLIDGLMADRVSWDVMDDFAADLFRAPSQIEFLNDIGHD